MALLWMSALVLVALEAGGGWCLRNVSLTVWPPAVEYGQTATLICNYDLENQPLYSVKWYRGTREIYRYTPNGKPASKVFPMVGVHIDVNQSNQTQVVLQNVGFSLAGNLSCEVTLESNDNFWSATVTAPMTVVEIPKSPPKLSVGGDRYKPGDMLDANCTFPPSRPPATLSFLINNNTVSTAETQYLNATEGRGAYYFLSLNNFKLRLSHFQDGRLAFRCDATLPGGFVKKSEQRQLGIRPSEPAPERVISPSSSGQRSSHPFLLATPLTLVILACLSGR